MTNGTSSWLRPQSEQSIQTAPAARATGSHCAATSASTAENTNSTPANCSATAAAVISLRLPWRTSEPAEAGEHSARTSEVGKRRRSSSLSSSPPTAPVAPRMATRYRRRGNMTFSSQQRPEPWAMPGSESLLDDYEICRIRFRSLAGLTPLNLVDWRWSWRRRARGRRARRWRPRRWRAARSWQRALLRRVTRGGRQLDERSRDRVSVEGLQLNQQR